MSSEYGYPEKRKSKNDKKKKRQMYRKGGKYRSANVIDTTSKGTESRKKR